jgi:hypothetical protein
MATETTSKQRVFWPDMREGKWWLFAYVGGLQKDIVAGIRVLAAGPHALAY